MPLKRIVAALRRPPKPHVTLGRLVATISAAVLAVLAGLYGLFLYPLLENTSSLEFCVSCHEMEATVYQEYKQSAHYRNRAGVRAECSDCHVPREFGPRFAAKIRASKDIWHSLIGTISTPEKFEAHRWTMATRVWEMMERTDSATCRACHTYESMAVEKQDRQGRRRHQSAMAEGRTCIECHKGLVHQYPKEPGSEEADSGPSGQPAEPERTG